MLSKVAQQAASVIAVKRLQFQYASDLHLDIGNRRLSDLKPVADRLVLAGDVSQVGWAGLPDFLSYCGKNWKDTYWVPGNHEFYGTSIVQARAFLDRDLKLPANVHVLLNRKVECGSVDVIGCTLWSKIPPAEAAKFMFFSDFCNIIGLNVTGYNFWHDQDTKWIRREILTNPNRAKLVITHHAPLMKGTSDPEYEVPGRFQNFAFCSDQSALLDLLPLGSAWIYGHTHHRTAFKYKDRIPVMTNAWGYPYELDPIVESICTIDP